ncbi:hypothetical protein N7523_010215 [Penicillium sp. IBT 18751x]|nr:hypothetical protein N7523_010215 [Penicillium sp. IBT 18751x]
MCNGTISTISRRQLIINSTPTQLILNPTPMHLNISSTPIASLHLLTLTPQSSHNTRFQARIARPYTMRFLQLMSALTGSLRAEHYYLVVVLRKDW